eukprot:TRINITY_DN59638_c0_g1_i1.p1 TRINITY_DN59638_c0_g1~~TRINITY_DN59638_c0_g1_i1.p1  ORF type:complete len:164 (-),score=30.95 TRINITY_DN59638_c0_g1_i1:15-506(-)
MMRWLRAVNRPLRRQFATTPNAPIKSGSPVPEPMPLSELSAMDISAMPKFAVVFMKGRQYKVTKGDLIQISRILAEVGERIHIRKVLMVGTPHFTHFGAPLLKEARVEAVIEEQVLGAKVIVFKKRKRTKLWKEHEAPVTHLRITDIHYALPAELTDSSKLLN